MDEEEAGRMMMILDNSVVKAATAYPDFTIEEHKTVLRSRGLTTTGKLAVLKARNVKYDTSCQIIKPSKSSCHRRSKKMA